MPSFRSYGAFVAAWPVSSITITSAPLDNAAYTSGSVCSILMAYTCLEATKRPHSPACIRYWHSSPELYVMVWAAIGLMARTSLVRIDGNFNADSYISDTLRQVVVPYLWGLPNVISQQNNVNHMSHVAFWPSSIRRVFDRCSSLQDLHICHPLKTSGHGLLRD